MKKKFLGRLLTMLLVAAMVFTLLPASAIAAAEWWGGDEYADDAATQATEDADDFIRVFLLDCGRKYFSVAQIEAIIDQLAANHYTHLELAIGNDALRFLLDDMSLTVNDKEYTSKQVSDAIHSGNINYYNAGQTNELTETDMNDIIAYAKTNGIEIIPLLNSPGHMDAILDAAEALTGKTCSYNGSARTIDVTNSTAVAFTQALIQKYIDYFAGNCKYFNIGADEYANDKTNGFSALISSNKYGSFVSYVNSIADAITSAGMTPMAFNDGIYYAGETGYGTFRTSIVVCYWTSGWNGYSPAAATFLTEKGHKILNTNDAWYYVLGRAAGNSSGYTIATATKGAQNTAYNNVPKQSYQSNPSDEDIIGCMQCLWCDTPSASYSTSEVSNVNTLISTFSKANSTVFVEPAEPSIVIKPSEGSSTGTTLDSTSETASVTLDAGEVVTWYWDPALVTLVDADTDVNTYAATVSLNAQRVTVTPVLNANGTAAITAEKAGKTAATYTVKVTDGSEAVEEQVINIAVGGETKITLDGNVVLNTDGLEKSIATVTAELKQTPGETKTELVKATLPTVTGDAVTGYIYDGSSQYLAVDSQGNVSKVSDIAKATQFTVKKASNKWYTIFGNGYYLKVDKSTFIITTYSLSTTTESDVYWTFDDQKGFCDTNYSRYLNYSSTWGWTASSSSGNGFLYDNKTTVINPTDQTLVTFKGVAAGTTYVTIDGKTYKIVVTDKAPENAMTRTSIDLEYWITNYEVYDGTSTSTNHTKSITTSTTGATSDEGIEIATIAPNKAYSFFDGTKTVYYWQAMRLDADNQQTNASGDDETADGTTLTHIRYHGGAWQYKTADGIWHYFQSTDQLVAYYLQKTEVTEEIDTYVKDWGYTTDGTTPDTSSSKGQVALTVAVVYPDGTVSPAEGSMYANSTSIFNYWDSRDIGIVAPTNNSDYTISKITVTDGKRDSDSSANVWYTSDSITWDKKDLEDGTSKWYDETVVWDKNTNAGTTPMVNGKASNITWSAKNTAKLVLIYLETVQKETNLNVVYYNDNDKEEIFSMQVAMTYNQGDTEPTYANSLYLYGTVNADGTVTDGTLIAENKSSWLSNVVGDAEYLPDAAYVVNAANKAQTFSKTLSTIPDVAAKYKSGVYQYISADISSDGKTLTLHYAINASKLDKKYIFDFGLPIEIPLSELVENYDDIEYLSVDGTNLFENSVKTAHGTLSYDSSSKSIVFTLDKTVDTQAPLTGSFRVKYTTATELSRAITIALIPASNVLYEESFLTGAAGWTLDTTTSLAASTAQETQKAKETKNVFGYDNAYVANNGNNVTGELGVWKASGLSATAMTGALTTSFYGNAFDLIGSCGPNTGRVMVMFTKSGETKACKAVIVDTRFSDSTIAENLYQVPWAHVEFKEEASYNVEIYASGSKGTSSAATQSVRAYSYAANNDAFASVLASHGMSMADVEYVNAADTISTASSPIATYAAPATLQPGMHVEIDGFRVYRSSSTATAGSVADNYPANEKNVTYNNILKVVKDQITAYTENDGNKTVSVKDYEANGGPQNEIYLGEGQSVTFSVGTTQTAIQVSLRAVSGTAQWATSADGNAVTITSNTEMYYAVTSNASGSVTIANRGTTLLAIGNVKLPDDVTTMSASEMDETAVYESVCAAFATSLPVDPEPDQTVFVPEHFSIRNYATPLFRHKLVTLRIDFSKDVSYVEIDGQKYYPSKFASWFGYYTVTFTDTIGRNDNYFYKVVFFDANGNPSETQSVYGK